MAYALKSSGQALDLVVCLIVDDDGSTIVDLCGNTPVVHANVTVGTSTWKGSSRGYFQTSGSSYTPYGVTFATPTVLPASSQASIFVALAGSSAGANEATAVNIGSGSASGGLAVWPTGEPRFGLSVSSGTGWIGTTDWPVDGSKFSFGGNYTQNSSAQVFFGLESGSLAADSTADNPGNVGFGDGKVNHIGGVGGQGFQPGKWHIIAVFDTPRTLAQLQDLHDDWFNELIDSGAASATITLTDPVAVVTGSTASCTITRSTAASGTITYNLSSSATGVATVPATATIADGQTTGTFNVTGVAAGSSTITATNAADSGETDTATANVSALKGLTVTFGQTGLTGLTFAWFDQASPDLFAAPTVVGTTESTDGSGVLEINLTGTSVAVGNTGFLLIYKAGATAPDDIAFFGRLTVQDIG